MFNGEETGLTLENDIVIELPVDKLISLEVDSDNDTSNDDSVNSNTGLIVTIVVVSLVVISIASFSVYWFVFKKKTLTDLVAIFKKK